MDTAEVAENILKLHALRAKINMQNLLSHMHLSSRSRDAKVVKKIFGDWVALAFDLQLVDVLNERDGQQIQYVQNHCEGTRPVCLLLRDGELFPLRLVIVDLPDLFVLVVIALSLLQEIHEVDSLQLSD